MATDGVAAVERALLILNVFDERHTAMTLHEMAQLTGMYKSTLLRICSSLERKGYIHRDGAGLFRLGATLWRLGSLYSRSFKLADYVYPVLDRLTQQTAECASFYIREGDSRICLFRRHSNLHIVRHHLEEGARLPLDRGGGGRVILAFSGAKGEPYESIRKAGYYVSMGEVEDALSSMAVPVHGADKRLAGALAVSGLRSRFSEEFVDLILPALSAEAAELGKKYLGLNLLGPEQA